ncbi:MAG TPA: MarR family transcriptional regulator [Synergistaceae bacterium]|nr:MarR family transcriptional regulator [Synergistaceae bacterium]HQH78289.1 MarR family transcriptional regulator [Synergistaceae bacterium]
METDKNSPGAAHPRPALYLAELVRARMHSYLEKKFAEAGVTDLSVSHGSILFWLYRSGGAENMLRIAEKIQRDKSTVTYLTRKLVEAGYARRRQCTVDRRSVFIELTEKGWRFQELFERVNKELTETAYKNFSDEEAHTLRQLLEKMASNLDENRPVYDKEE